MKKMEGLSKKIEPNLQRIANLISHEPNVQEEKIIDTLRDFGTHSKIYLDSKKA